MSGRKSQRKGRAAELELSRILQSYGYPVEAGRAQSYGEVPDLSGLPGIHIEVKRREQVNLSAALEQARRDAARFGGLPAVFHRRNRESWRVTMPLTAWLEIYKLAFSGNFGRSGKAGDTNDRQTAKSTCSAD